MDPQRQRETALENEQLRLAVGLRRLCFETGRWRGDLLTDGMTASGRCGTVDDRVERLQTGWSFPCLLELVHPRPVLSSSWHQRTVSRWIQISEARKKSLHSSLHR